VPVASARAARATRAVIALTGFGQLDDRRHALEAESDRHFAKPINTGELLVLETPVAERAVKSQKKARGCGS
jgi:DNA-binding response OmpR family regulator